MIELIEKAGARKDSAARLLLAASDTNLHGILADGYG